MTEAALETVGLGRRYGTKWGLRDCSLTLTKGSITGLVGPNGAGKSTLLRLSAGLSRPTTGTIRVFGEDIRPNSTTYLPRIGYFDQLKPLYGALRVREMLTFGRKFNSKWDDEAALGWLNELRIPLEEKVEKLSLGQQAQVALAVCMGKRPDLLLLDEPVASLDPLARRQLLETLLGVVAEQDVSVLLSSHIVAELEPVCDNLIILSASRVQISGTIEALLHDHRLLVGPRSESPPTGLEIISSRAAARQSTLLVRGHPSNLGAAWQVTSPDLEEVVLAYLSKQADERGGSTGPTEGENLS
jgi:ABC-2 type transport system ATP-binding protein